MIVFENKSTRSLDVQTNTPLEIRSELPPERSLQERLRPSETLVVKTARPVTITITDSAIRIVAERE